MSISDIVISACKPIVIKSTSHLLDKLCVVLKEKFGENSILIEVISELRNNPDSKTAQQTMISEFKKKDFINDDAIKDIIKSLAEKINTGNININQKGGKNSIQFGYVEGGVSLNTEDNDE
jgi:hypothetical protein